MPSRCPGGCVEVIVFCVGGADAALLAPEFHLLEANALADQLPFKAWGCGVRAIADTKAEVPLGVLMPYRDGWISGSINHAVSERHVGLVGLIATWQGADPPTCPQ